MENDLKFTGQNPVMINFNGDTEDIYAPIKTTSCDVDIVSDHILDDLYSANLDEICVKIDKGTHRREWVVVFDDQGSVESLRMSPDPTSDQCYTISYKNLFYEDINGDFRFNGSIKDANNVETQVNLKYILSNNCWKNDNFWDMENGDWYFYNASDSYKIHWNGTNHTIQEKTAEGWTTAVSYNKVDQQGNITDCAYSVDNIIKTINGGMELVWGKERYFWDSINLKWYETTPYTDVDGAGYFAIYGKYYRKIRYSNGTLIDTCVVNGVDSGEVSDWVAWLDPTDSTFTKIIPLQNRWDFDSLFTDDDGYLYFQRNDGVILFWSWDVEQWIEWAKFEDSNVTPISFYVDYVIPGNTKRVVVKYNNTNMDTISFQLYNFDAPSAHLEERILPDIVYNTIWEGYKVPNTYSQDVTLNLDEIMITAIDPVSIMKYLKIDRLYTKPNVVSYADFFGKAISYVMLHSQKVMVENTVSYGGTYDYTNGLLDLKFQVSNFWDEMGEPATVYEVIEELLRPFCMTFCYDNDTFQIYDKNKTEGTRTFQVFTCIPEGLLMPSGSEVEETVVDENWKDNNIQNPVIEIGSTYSKVTGVASTQIPEYSSMAIDMVDYNDRDKYDVFDANIQTNKSKGYEVKSTSIRPVINDKDKWFYIWNGVYVNEDYGLKSQGDYVNGYLNINGAYKYLTGDSGHPADWGSILNFYGGSLNPTGTGKEQSTEKSVNVKKRITAYFPDNGTPLEFLEDSDLIWDYNGNVTYSETVNINPEISKPDSSDSKFGNPIVMSDSNQITYHQEYENLRLEATNQQTVDLSIVQSYSRTGIDSKIDIMNNNTCYDKHFLNYENQNWLDTAKVNYFPKIWNSSNVVVDKYYFSRYRTQETLLRPSRVRPVWDRRRVDIYIRTSDNKIHQFNGKEWVEDTEVRSENSFYLLKMMNGEHLYHTDFRYDVIETADYDSSNPNAGGHYSLTGERYTYYVDEVGGVTTKSVSGGTTYYCDPYTGEENIYLDKCSEGSISIKLPELDDIGANVVVDIYNSTLLGSTGSNDTSSYNHYENIWFEDPDGNVVASFSHILFQPYNTSYVKAEHLDLDISMSVPESNLGQMFSQSDIKYIADNRKNYMEEFETAPFRINTFNDLVLSSFSYLIFGSDLADPGDFIIKGVSGRPEGYVVQAYMNWLGIIRKIYSKTIVPSVERISNTRGFITSSEVGYNKLMIISDNWDLKTNRHSIKAIECQNLDVDYVGTTDAIEIPRKARNDLFNLPTAVKK